MKLCVKGVLFITTVGKIIIPEGIGWIKKIEVIAFMWLIKTKLLIKSNPEIVFYFLVNSFDI